MVRVQDTTKGGKNGKVTHTDTDPIVVLKSDLRTSIISHINVPICIYTLYIHESYPPFFKSKSCTELDRMGPRGGGGKWLLKGLSGFGGLFAASSRAKSHC